MFVLLLAVPALLVVTIGYVVGFGLWRWLGGLVDCALGTSLAAGAEGAGWITGLLLLIGCARAVVRQWRRRARNRAE
jgi:hypothetical protein